MRLIESAWRGASPGARAIQWLLLPAAGAWRVASGIRNAMYDWGALPSLDAGIPVVSVGNLTVGGTGKTPVAAWVAAELRKAGGHPAIVMRGYGNDEPRVHEALNPDIPVVVEPDRVRGARAAAASGCDVVVLDDGFQHRRLRRQVDLVLVSVDAWQEPIRLLPAGPWRELPAALRRASMVIVTRKVASGDAAESLLRRLEPMTAAATGAIATLSLDALRQTATGAERPLGDLEGARVLAVGGIGDPSSFERQLGAQRATVTMRAFPDHHVYDAEDVASLVRDASSHQYVVCTLKDAVKLARLWPREGPPLWYVSLRCEVEVGRAEVSALLDQLLAARRIHNR